MKKTINLLAGALVFAAAAVAIYLVLTSNYAPTTDADRIPPTDPALIKYRELGPIRTGFKESRNLAVGPSDRIYVSGDNAVRVFDKTGRPVSEITREKFRPGCLAVHRDGTFFVDADGFIEVFAPDGKAMKTWRGDTTGAALTSIALTDDEVFVADAANRVVLRYDKSGLFLNRIGEQDPQKRAEGLLVPSLHLDVAVGIDGMVRVTNPGRLRIETYAPDGDLKESWGKPAEGISDIEGFCGCCNPTDFALLHDGRIVTSEKGIPRVKVYSSTGTFEAVVAPPEAFPQAQCPAGDCRQGKALDVAVDSTGRILVLDPAINAVRIFVPKEGEIR